MKINTTPYSAVGIGALKNAKRHQAAQLAVCQHKLPLVSAKQGFAERKANQRKILALSRRILALSLFLPFPFLLFPHRPAPLGSTPLVLLGDTN